MISDETDKVMEGLFDSFKNRYESMKCSEVVFDYVHLWHYKCYKIKPDTIILLD